MFAVIDCGTTNTRIYLVDEKEHIAASGEVKIGTRDTSITGSKDKLRNGINSLYHQIISEAGLRPEDVEFAVASGMITSEIGLIDLPHLTAPAGMEELAAGLVCFEDGEFLSLGCPIYFVRGIKNSDRVELTADSLRNADFMRGEEVQCMGILKEENLSGPYNIVVLSSHTKNIYIDEKNRIVSSYTTISGQFYEALLNATFLGSSVRPSDGEKKRYSREDIVDLAVRCTQECGMGRTLLMTRFMQVLMNSHSEERKLFLETVIAADDMKAFEEMRQQGFDSGRYLLVGQPGRSEQYQSMLKKYFAPNAEIRILTDKARISQLTVSGCAAVARAYVNKKRSEYTCSE